MELVATTLEQIYNIVNTCISTTEFEFTLKVLETTHLISTYICSWSLCCGDIPQSQKVQPIIACT
jgi:hypothetical protein